MAELDSTTQTEQDEFGAAFADLAKNLKEPGSSAVDAATSSAAQAASSSDTSAPKPGEPAAAAPVAASAPAPAAPDAIATELADARRRIAELEAVKAAPPEKQPEAAPPEKPIYTAEEQAVLDKYTSEWDVVKQGEELIRRAEYKQLVGYIFDQIQQVYGPALQYIESRSGRDQYSDIKELVPDYDAVRDKTIEWAKAQPSFLKTAYERVISEGTPQEVRDLIDIYRKATGVVAPGAAPAAAPVLTAVPSAPASGGGMALSAEDPKRTAAITALKPVQSQRTDRAEGPDPTDFAGAFAEFTAGASR